MPASLLNRRSCPTLHKKQRKHRNQVRKRQRRLRFETLEVRRVLATISGQIAYDFDGDGLLEADEPGLQDWQIYVDTDNDGQFDADVDIGVQSDLTGSYELTDLTAGFHIVRVEPQLGWDQTFPPGIGKHTVNIRTLADDVAGINFAEKRIFTDFVDGDILVTRSSLADTDLLLEYTPAGELVQAIVIPGTEDTSSLVAKDLVVDSQGNVQIFAAEVVTQQLPFNQLFEGYDEVRLTTFDPDTQTFSDTDVEDWDMGRTFDHWGDIAAFGDYVFANEQIDDGGTANGVIRFDVSDLSFQRFSDSFAMPTELTIGQDGLLYTLSATANNTTVQAHDPETMQSLRTFNIPQQLQSVVVDGQGNLYALTDTGLKHFAPDGRLVKSDPEHNGDDIAIGQDGVLLLTSKLSITVTDTDFSSFASFKVPGNAGVNFLAYAAIVQDPVGDGQSGEVVDYGVFTAGNILVSNSPEAGGGPKLYEYTPFGQLVQEHDIPVFESGGARDLVMDSEQNVQIYNGTFEPRLSTFDSQPGGFIAGNVQFDGWSTADRPTYGGMASNGDFVFATDVKTQDDQPSERGIVRYDVTTETFERFHSEHGDIIDLNVGLDGLLYTLGPANQQVGTVVRQYHPITMNLLGTVALPANHRAIAVDANGDIFAANPDIHRYTAAGVPVGEPLEDGVLGGLTDIDIDQDGRLLIAAGDGHILVTDRKFTSLYTFETRDSDGLNFAAFVSPAREFPKAVWDSFTLPQDSVAVELDVLANDTATGLGLLMIVSADQGSDGGSVSLLGNTMLSYSPASGFVGVETFTYTISDGIGGFDRAVVTITVEGNANFFVIDDSYTVAEDTDLIVDDDDPLVLPKPLLLDNDGALDIFPVLTPGNLLVAHSPVGSDVNALLQEYTPFGTLVRSITLPDFSDGFGDVRDIVLDRNGNVQIYNGTFEPRLTTYDPVTNALSHTTYTNWNTTPNVTYGGLAAWRNFVYATDQEVAGDHPSQDEGIVRFDIETGEIQRFVNDGNFIDVTVGLDGLLYALGPGGTAAQQQITVFDPSTMQQGSVIQGLHADTRAITVDANGDIYAVRYRNPSVYRYNSSGTLMWTYNTRLNSNPAFPEADFADIDIHENGRSLLIANVNFSNTDTAISPWDGDVVLFNLFTQQSRVLQAPDANSDMKFAAWIQAPVGSLSEPITVSSYTQPSHGTVLVELDGSFIYTPDPDYSGTDGFTYVARDADGEQRSASVTINVTAQNDQPILEAALPALSSDEDAVLTLPLVALINGGPGTTTITDADLDDPLGGIAVTETSGPGAWSYSIGGTVFVDIGLVSDTEAMLLPYGADIRFTPSGGAGGTAAFTYRAWDQTVGGEGNKFSTTYEVCLLGGVPDEEGLCPDLNPPDVFVYEYFSEDKDTLTLTLSDLNDAPILVPNQPTIGLTDEHTQIDVAIGDFVAGMSDPDGSGGQMGVAIVGAAGNGLWEYSLNGTDYVALPTVSDAFSLLLDRDDRLRYTPDGLNGEVAEIEYRAWDETDGRSAGATVDTSENGGSTAYSVASDTGLLGVADVNDAPALIPASPQIGTTDVVTVITVELSDFVTGITDVDRGASVGGIAVSQAVGEGVWSYSSDRVTFTDFPGTLDTTSALLLHRNVVIRYTPAGGDPETATIAYVAWDATMGSGGSTADITNRGDQTAFSIDSDMATLTVTEINDPPDLTGLTVPVAYEENDPPIAVFPDIVITDADSPDFEGGTLTAAIVSGGTPNDQLSIRDTNEINVVGDLLYYDSGGPKLIGSFMIDNWVLTVYFANQQATPAAAQAVARAVSYENVSEDPTATDRRVSLTVTDGDVGNDTSVITQTVTVQPVNDPPSGSGESYDVYTGGRLDINILDGVLANDSDAEGDELSAVLFADTTHGDLIFLSDGSFTYEPDTLYYGIDTFAYQAFDGQDLSAVYTVVINVVLPPTNPANAADVNADGWVSPLDPVLIANYLILNGAGPLPQPYVSPPFVDFDGDGSVTQADVDGAADDINRLGSRQLPPPRLELEQNDPLLGQGEFVRITLRTTDAAGTPISDIDAGQQFYVEAWVSDQRLDPQGVAAAFMDVVYDSNLVSASGSVMAGSEYPDFLTGEIGTAGIVDETGAGRTTTLPGGADYLLVRVPMLALARGEAAFTSNPADVMPAGQVLLFGIDGPVPAENVTYGTASITIKGPPVAENDAYDVDEDGNLSVSASNGVLQNDSDDDNDPLTAVLGEGPAHGSLQLDPNGSFEYTPDEDYSGIDQFTYNANDGVFDSNKATVTINVIGSNDQPVAVDDQYSVFRNEELVVSVADGVIANDYDADGDTLDADLVQLPNDGTVTLNDDGSFTYTPDEDFGGQDRFTYFVHDGTLPSNVATVDINVFFDWQNPTHPVDVNGDGFASPLDALLIFNDLEENGVRTLPNPPVPPDVAPPFFDVNGDGVLSSFDGRKVMEDLQINGARLLPLPRLDFSQPQPPLGNDPLVRFRVETTDPQGVAGSTFGQGDMLLAKVYVTDLRTSGSGVFSAYLDLLYDQAGLALDGAVTFGPSFPDVQAGSVATLGIVDEVGAVQSTPTSGDWELLLFEVPLLATAQGDFEITAERADMSPISDVTLSGINGPIPSNLIEYSSATITVVVADSDGDGVIDRQEDGAPNNGDGNDDGIPDRLQGNVASLPSDSSGLYVTLESPAGYPLQNVHSADNPSPGDGPANVQFPLGFIGFDVSGVPQGEATTVTVYLEQGAQANTSYRYGPTPDNAAPHWYPFLAGVDTGATIYGSRIEVDLVSGQKGDDAPQASGISVGFAAFGLSQTPWRNPSLAEDIDNDGIVKPLDALLLINKINASGALNLPLIPTADLPLPPFWDPDGDDILAASDVLRVIEYINGRVPGGEGEGEFIGLATAATVGNSVIDVPAAERWIDSIQAARHVSGDLDTPRFRHRASLRDSEAIAAHWSDAPDETRQRVRGPAMKTLHSQMSTQPFVVADSLHASAGNRLDVVEQTIEDIAGDVARGWRGAD